MSSIADKIAKKLFASRKSKITDLAAWDDGREMALKDGFSGEGPIPEKFAHLDPCHTIYVMAQSIVSVMSEQISTFKEAKGYAKIVSAAQDEYLPCGPPMSPMTTSYFAMWSYFDVRSGSSNETGHRCILRLGSGFDFQSWLTDAVKLMAR